MQVTRLASNHGSIRDPAHRSDCSSTALVSVSTSCTDLIWSFCIVVLPLGNAVAPLTPDPGRDLVLSSVVAHQDHRQVLGRRLAAARVVAVCADHVDPCAPTETGQSDGGVDWRLARPCSSSPRKPSVPRRRPVRGCRAGFRPRARRPAPRPRPASVITLNLRLRRRRHSTFSSSESSTSGRSGGASRRRFVECVHFLGVQLCQQRRDAAQFGDGSAAARAGGEMCFELPPFIARQRAKDIGGVPHCVRVVAAPIVVAVRGLRHRVTPISCRVSRNARTA